MATFSRYRSPPRDKVTSMEDSDTSSATSSSTGIPTSLYYTLLPSLIQRRIPGKFRSLKQALANYDSSTPPQTSTATARTRHIRIPSVESITPPPSYQSNDSDAGSRPGSSSASESGSISSRPASSSGHLPTARPHLPKDSRPRNETLSGVGWKYARPGISFLELAASEACSVSKEEDGGHYSARTNFVRRQYIDGVVCVLRGLPGDLSLEEESCLRDALPSSQIYNNKDAAAREGRGQLTFRPELKGREDKLSAGQRRQPQSTLHQCVATTTLYIFLAIAFLTPYIQLLLQRAYRLDRKYHVSERALAQGVIAVDAMGKQAVVIARGVCGWNEGKIGEIVKEVGGYCLQGVGGGVTEGVGDGMRAVGLRDRDESRRGLGR